MDQTDSHGKPRKHTAGFTIVSFSSLPMKEHI
jgi:hypothetical protein